MTGCGLYIVSTLIEHFVCNYGVKYLSLVKHITAGKQFSKAQSTIRVLEELVAKNIRDEMIWSP